MESKAFLLLKNSEHSWWYEGRSALVLKIFQDMFQGETSRLILDMGCGFGGMIGILKKFGFVYGLEPQKVAQDYAAERGYIKIFYSFEEVTQSLVKYDVVGLFDVLEHTPNDFDFLLNTRLLLNDSGYIIFTVPAFPTLFGAHDVSHHHFRRYTKKSIHHVFKNAGFEVVYIRYWNFIFFPIIAILRKVGVAGESSFRAIPLFDWIFKKIIFFDTYLSAKLSVPFGLTLYGVARKRV